MALNAPAACVMRLGGRVGFDDDGAPQPRLPCRTASRLRSSARFAVCRRRMAQKTWTRFWTPGWQSVPCPVKDGKPSPPGRPQHL